jgi:acyl carrier protein
VLAPELNVAREQLTPEARIVADLAADSLDVVQISMALEDRFNLTIPDEHMEKAETVEELYHALGTLLAQAGCHA